MSIYQTINLYKQNIPFLGQGLDKRQYFTFGHFDALDILPQQSSLNELWRNYSNNSNNHDGLYTSQPIFLTREAGWDIDDDFTDIESCKDEPFIFIALLNRKTEGKNSEDIAENLITGKSGYGPDDAGMHPDWLDWIKSVSDRLRGKRMTGMRAYRFACYYPLNISQGAVRFHASRYTEVVHLLADLQRIEPGILYSFTISGINYNWIKDNSKPAWTDTGELNVSFDIVANHPQHFHGLIVSLDALFMPDMTPREFKDSHLEVIGSSDIRLTYQDVEPQQLLNAYRTIITPDNEYYRFGASSFVSSWSTPMYEIMQADVATRIGKPLKKEITFEMPDERISILSRRVLTILINAAGTLEKSQYMHYIDSIIKPAVKTLLNIIKKYIEMESEGDSRNEDFNGSINRFLQYSQDLLTSTLRSDRQFFEAPGFNMVLEETPIKIMAAYNACLYEMRSALKEKDETETDDTHRSYAFLVHPSMSETMTADLFFLMDDEKYRLYHISLPGNDMFNLRKLLPQLVHETGHCICNRKRHRELRYQRVLSLVSMLLVHHIYPVSSISNDDFKCYTNEFCNYIKQYIEHLHPESNKKHYTRLLKTSLKEAAEATLIDSDFQNRLWAKLINRPAFLKEKEENGGYITISQWHKLEVTEAAMIANRYKMLSIFPEGLNCEMIVDFALDIARECYADIVMIQMLRMSADEYLLSFLDAVPQTDFLADRMIFERISAVLRVMTGPDGWIYRKDNEHAIEKAKTEAGNVYKKPRLYSCKERDYLAAVRDALENNCKPWLTVMLKATIDVYLTICRNSLLEHELTAPLLTERLYHETFGPGPDGDAIGIIQQLLWRTGKEV